MKQKKPIKKLDLGFISNHPNLNINCRTAKLEIECKRSIVRKKYKSQVMELSSKIRDYLAQLGGIVENYKDEINAKRA